MDPGTQISEANQRAEENFAEAKHGPYSSEIFFKKVFPSNKK